MLWLLVWWRIQEWFRRCPECRARGYSAIAPRWSEDKVAHMLGVAQYGCPSCGKGAIEERAERIEADDA